MSLVTHIGLQLRHLLGLADWRIPEVVYEELRDFCRIGEVCYPADLRKGRRV